jgi:hypothetical protein
MKEHEKRRHSMADKNNKHMETEGAYASSSDMPSYSSSQGPFNSFSHSSGMNGPSTTELPHIKNFSWESENHQSGIVNSSAQHRSSYTAPAPTSSFFSSVPSFQMNAMNWSTGNHLSSSTVTSTANYTYNDQTSYYNSYSDNSIPHSTSQQSHSYSHLNFTF